MRLIDLTGRRFGRLVVINRAPNSGRDPRWNCRCDCGRMTVVFGSNLRRGLTTSCTCYRSEKNSSLFTEDLSGRRFGSLTVVRRAPDYVAPNRARHVRWACRCECGRSAVTSANDLRSGHTTTCGCHRYPHLIDAEHVLYRLYDALGSLLYVGITNEWRRRKSEHERGQPWWPEVEFVTREFYPNRQEVLAAERAAIRSEKPVFNRTRYEGVMP